MQEAVSLYYEKFDVFLSHSFLDAQLVGGTRNWLRDLGLSVYVYWIEDRQLDRESVTSETATLLRSRLQLSECRVCQ
jgi:hypothetical protein